MTNNSKGEMEIEEFLYREDPYRSNTSRVKYPLPLYLETVPENISSRLNVGTPLHKAIVQLLQRHSIEPRDVNLFYQSKPGYARGGDKRVLALHFYVQVPDGATTEQWSPAKQAMEVILSEHGMSDAIVEISDPKRRFQPALLPIAPTNPCIALYETIRHELVTKLCDQLDDLWNSMSVYGVRHISPDSSTSYQVVITVDEFASHDWLTLREILQGIINTAVQSDPHGGSEIGVLFIPGSARFGLPSDKPSDQERPGKSFASVLDDLPNMGASIGVEGNPGGGTLGGYMTLKFGDHTHRGFLTNSHVVSPSESATKALKERYATEGVSIIDPITDAIRTKIQWMANKDIVATRQEFDRLEKAQVADIERVENTIAMRTSIGLEAPATAETNLQRLKEGLEAMRVSKRISDMMPKEMGRVLFSTGCAYSATDYILDFAFVRIPPNDKDLFDHCAKSNRLPPKDDSLLLKHSIRTYGAPEGDMTKEEEEDYYVANRYDAPPRISGFGPLVKGSWYFKIGRTTGLTTGICHGTEVYVNLGGTRTKYDDLGVRQGPKTHAYTEEYIVMCSRFAAGLNIDNFCDSGDSGSLIIDREGQAVAILYGSITGKCGPDHRNNDKQRAYSSDVGLVTPMERVQENLKLMTQVLDKKTGAITKEGATLAIL